VLALLARWRRSASEIVIEKSAELFFALPDLLVLMSLGVAVRTLQGDGRLHLPMLIVMTLSLTAIGWAGPTRQLLARLRSVEGQGFVEASEALGQTRGRILVRHLLPYIGDYLLAIFLLRVPAVILMESTVSFLGMGLPADEPSLGAILGMHYDKLLYPGAEWVVLPAWLTLVVLVLSFQAAGKSLLSGAEERR
jgi:peptide/nickel transport system permease protein